MQARRLQHRAGLNYSAVSTSTSKSTSSSSRKRGEIRPRDSGLNFDNAPHARVTGQQQRPYGVHHWRRLKTHLDDPFGGKMRNRVS